MKFLVLIFALQIWSPLVQTDPIPLVFKNNSLKSIPLKIPGVMNPNLSPMSKSGVSLRIGQKIFFKYRLKSHLLLEIKDQNPGDVIIINELIKKRKKELGLK